MRMIMMKMTTTMVRKKTCNYLLSCHDYIFLTSIVKRIPQKMTTTMIIMTMMAMVIVMTKTAMIILDCLPCMITVK